MIDREVFVLFIATDIVEMIIVIVVDNCTGNQYPVINRLIVTEKFQRENILMLFTLLLSTYNVNTK